MLSSTLSWPPPSDLTIPLPTTWKADVMTGIQGPFCKPENDRIGEQKAREPGTRRDNHTSPGPPSLHFLLHEKNEPPHFKPEF